MQFVPLQYFDEMLTYVHVHMCMNSVCLVGQFVFGALHGKENHLRLEIRAVMDNFAGLIILVCMMCLL